MSEKKLKVKLRSYLKERKISIVKLSEATGIGRHWLHDFIDHRAKLIPIKNIEAICSFLDCSTIDLFEVENAEILTA